jgi:hypothetical protein
VNDHLAARPPAREPGAHPSRRTPLLAVLLAAAMLAGGCASAGPTPSPSPPGSAAPTAAPTPDSTPSPSPGPTEDPSPSASASASYAVLNGVAAEPALAMRLPVAVMIDDGVRARPQYGYTSASIVYQAPADGGETRYMFIYQETDASRVEPIRSGRPYFVNWASEYRSAFAHYGGDRKTLRYIPTIDKRLLWDVDALAASGGSGVFRRDPARVAPHNAYSSSTLIRERAVARGAGATLAEGIAERPFADDLPRAERPNAGSILVPYKRGSSGYTYDADTNSYLRSVAGKAQIDAADGTRVTARNVVVLFMRLSIDPESEPNHRRPMLDHVGSGKALVFRDGKVIAGTWQKPSASELTRFYDAAGREITLVRGRIFIQVVATGTDVEYDAAS